MQKLNQDTVQVLADNSKLWQWDAEFSSQGRSLAVLLLLLRVHAASIMACSKINTYSSLAFRLFCISKTSSSGFLQLVKMGTNVGFSLKWSGVNACFPRVKVPIWSLIHPPSFCLWNCRYFNLLPENYFSYELMTFSHCYFRYKDTKTAEATYCNLGNSTWDLGLSQGYWYTVKLSV